MARTDFTHGENPTLNGPHVVAVLAGEAADQLAAAIVPVISTADSLSTVAAAVSAHPEFADVDVVLAQFLGSMMVARVRGGRFALHVLRRDGVEATFSARRASAPAELRELEIVSVEIVDTTATADAASSAPLPFGWQLSSSVSYASDAELTPAEIEEWLEQSTSSARFDPPVVRGLEFSDGRRIIVDRTVLIGRSPQAAPSTSGEVPAVFAVESPKRDISRTHLRIFTDGGQVLLEDLNSTNGTEVTPVGGIPFLLEPGSPALLEDGMVVSIGDHVAFRVVTVQ